jgi:hypothetical protein
MFLLVHCYVATETITRNNINKTNFATDISHFMKHIRNGGHVILLSRQ